MLNDDADVSSENAGERRRRARVSPSGVPPEVWSRLRIVVQAYCTAPQDRHHIAGAIEELVFVARDHVLRGEQLVVGLRDLWIVQSLQFRGPCVQLPSLDHLVAMVLTAYYAAAGGDRGGENELIHPE